MIQIRALVEYAAHAYQGLLNIVAPPFCASCYIWLSDSSVLCDQCVSKIQPIVSKTISITQSVDMQVLAISGYTDPLKSLILAKNSVNPAASRQLGVLIWHHTMLRHIPCDFLIPVPLHWTRYAWRGYNQAEEMAQELGARLSKPVIYAVRRIRKTPYQSLVPFAERHENVKDVFTLNICNEAAYQGKHLVIVDDLMTSGATLTMVAKQLLKLKPASVNAVVACRVT